MRNLILVMIIFLFLATSPAFADETADENEALKQRIEYLERELERSPEKTRGVGIPDSHQRLRSRKNLRKVRSESAAPCA